MAPERLLRITYTKSAIGYAVRQKRTIRSLGLRRIGDRVLQPDNPAVRGMLLAVGHLVRVEPVSEVEVVTLEGGKSDETE